MSLKFLERVYIRYIEYIYIYIMYMFVNCDWESMYVRMYTCMYVL